MPPARTTPRRRLICLAGFMGCGKTTVGRLLARHLGWLFVDLDTRIVEHAGLSITEIFDRFGEPAFREIERERLLEALGEAAEQDTPTVLALGGGTFVQPENVALLREYGAGEGPASAAWAWSSGSTARSKNSSLAASASPTARCSATKPASESSTSSAGRSTSRPTTASKASPIRAASWSRSWRWAFWNAVQFRRIIPQDA